MDRMIVVVFGNEKKAYEGLRAFKELHEEGSLSLYDTAVIVKDAKGGIGVKQTADRGHIGAGVGLATGSLIGLLGGPIGLVIGAGVGAFSGSLYDMAQLGVGTDFLDEVSKYLSPGKVALVAEVEEGWVTPLDTRMEALGGTVFRRARSEFIDTQLEREIASQKSELAALKAEHAQAKGDAKAKLEAKVKASQERLQAQRAAFEKKIAGIKEEGEAKIKMLADQDLKVTKEAKSAVERRMADIRSHYDARVEKLNKAWDIATSP